MIEQAEKLKAAHRTTVAAKLAEEQRIKAETDAASEAGFKAAVAKMVADRGVEWLAEYGTPAHEKDGDRLMVYHLPGHQPLIVVFCLVSNTEWTTAAGYRRSTWPWYVGQPEIHNWNGYHSLAEALCKAEDPIPVEEPIPF